jgi:uncharacterized membrane protein YgcG
MGRIKCACRQAQQDDNFLDTLIVLEVLDSFSDNTTSSSFDNDTNDFSSGGGDSGGGGANGSWDD